MHTYPICIQLQECDFSIGQSKAQCCWSIPSRINYVIYYFPNTQIYSPFHVQNSIGNLLCLRMQYLHQTTGTNSNFSIILAHAH